MNILSRYKLTIEKYYWAFRKRYFKKKQKTNEDWAAKGYIDNPKVSFIIESHNKSNGVKHIVESLRAYPDAEIIVIDDGSTLSHTRSLVSFLKKGNEFLVRANDLYEIIMYDKCIRFANGEYIVLLQDDDKYDNIKWVDKAIEYFRKYPDMVILGGLEGLNITWDDQKKRCHGKSYSNLNSHEFKFVHHVNRAPMILNKELFSTHLKSLDKSFAPVLYDDMELCLRAWTCCLKVGWYNVNPSSLIAGGMRIWNSKLLNQQAEKNCEKIYELYKPHAEKIDQLVAAANKEISIN